MLSDEIRAVVDRHPIVEVLQQLGFEPPPRWNGSSDFMIGCPSPAHEDSTPSCIVHSQTDRYYCFGCGVHGDALQLVRDVTGIRSIKEAADVLVNGPIRPAARHRTTVARPVPQGQVDLQRTSLERVLAVNEAAWRELTTPAALRIAEGYLERRGLDVPRLNELLLGPIAGYPPSGADGLVTRLRGMGFEQAEIVDAGWAIRTRGAGVIDRFRRRVVFPYWDEEGHMLGVIGRDVTGQARQKYVNTPTTAAFRKSAVLYEPQRVAADNDCVVICEGPLDALAVVANSAALGFESAQAVAVSGTALTATHAVSLRGSSAGPVVLLPDSDAAGETARSRWRSALAEMGMVTWDQRAPQGLDPATWLAGEGLTNRRQLHCAEPGMK